MPGRNLTLDDVALAAGVARVTVSRVINRDPQVSDRTRKKVNDAIVRLGYSVNHQARALASGGSRRLILFHAGSPDREPNSYYDSGLELGALRESSSRGYDLASRTVDPDEIGLPEHIAAIVRSERPAGVILPPPLCDNHRVLDALEELAVPVAAVSASPDVRVRVPSVGIDDYAAGKAIASHLYDLGHRKVGFLSGPSTHRSAATRFEGFKDQLGDVGVAVRWVAEGDFTFRSGIDLANQLIAARLEVTALACANDDMAAGAMLAFHRHGLNLPQQLSITGFDDTPVSQIVWPPLTTIRQPIQAYGEQAVAMLDQPAATDGHSHQPVPFELVVRESTAAVA